MKSPAKPSASARRDPEVESRQLHMDGIAGFLETLFRACLCVRQPGLQSVELQSEKSVDKPENP